MQHLLDWLRQNFWVTMGAVCLLAQLVNLRLWLACLRSSAARRAAAVVFLLFNAGWAVTASLLASRKMGGGWWTLVGRPSVSWQLGCVLILVPVALVLLVWYLARLTVWIRARRSRRRGSVFGVPGPAGRDGFDPGRRVFLRRAAALGLGTAAGLCGYGVALQSVAPGLRRRELFYPDLPGGLDGFVVCQITDVHLGMWSTAGEARLAFEAAAREKPDLVLLTGDLVDRDPEYARQYLEPLELLSGVPHGVYGVLGNHDHYTGSRRIVELLDGRGVVMLVERRLSLPDAPVSLVGLDDQNSGSWMGSYLSRKRSGLATDPDVLRFDRQTGPRRRPGDFAILMNHRPEGYAQADREGFDLYLAGHTHGGQYQVPFRQRDNLAGLFYRYSSGLYFDHDCYLNVSRGLSSVGLPFRLFAWPEIDLLTLRRGPRPARMAQGPAAADPARGVPRALMTGGRPAGPALLRPAGGGTGTSGGTTC
ncbi:MAG: metallophosphoesterase [Deltaproteobacteria bacterium]|nr:metallophosphoesterase [Deltaproteobacteria bacterium]